MDEKATKEIKGYLKNIIDIMNYEYVNEESKNTLIENVLNLVYLSGKIDEMERRLFEKYGNKNVK